jgi:hypothetical protein
MRDGGRVRYFRCDKVGHYEGDCVEEIKRDGLNERCKEYSEECSGVPRRGYRLILESLGRRFSAIMNEGTGKIKFRKAEKWWKRV